MVGVEPTRQKTPVSKTGAATNYATRPSVRQGSNLRLPESKSGGIPLAYELRWAGSEFHGVPLARQLYVLPTRARLSEPPALGVFL